MTQAPAGPDSEYPARESRCHSVAGRVIKALVVLGEMDPGHHDQECGERDYAEN